MLSQTPRCVTKSVAAGRGEQPPSQDTPATLYFKKKEKKRKEKKRREEKRREEKRREEKRRDKTRQGREGKGREGKGREGKERKGKERKGKERKGKERKDYAFRRQFNEKPRTIPGCPDTLNVHQG